MGRRLIGIDFSGNAAMWRAGCRTSNVWIAEGLLARGGLSLVRVERVQERYAGAASPFHALAAELSQGAFAAAGIDAPFCVPARHLPPGGHRELLELVATLDREASRPFPRGETLRARLVALTEEPALAKPLRPCEAHWRSAGVNVRSTMWAGARGGAPMTAACLELLAHARRPMWPWIDRGEGLLSEVFPAAQLKTWGLPHELYDASTDDRGGRVNRARIVTALRERIDLGESERTLLDHADAIDAVLCLFGAKAVAQGRFVHAPGPDAKVEGWIAVHP